MLSNIPKLSIERPVFVTCLFFLTIVTGLICLKKISVDLYPDISYPVVAVVTNYSGAGPKEIESLISKPIEEELSGIKGLESIRSISRDGASIVVVTFKLGTDMEYGEQQIRDRVSSARPSLPDDLDQDPIIRTFDPNEQSIMTLNMSADLSQTKLYDLAEQQIKPMLENIDGVASVEISGGRKREISVLLDKNKLLESQLSATQIVNKLKETGKNIPGGKIIHNNVDSNIRTIGEFESIDKIKDTIISFYGNESGVKIKDVGQVIDGMEDEETRNFVNGSKAITFSIYKISNSNSVQLSKNVKESIKKINESLSTSVKGFTLFVTKDDSTVISNNIYDIGESIIIGIILTVVAVYLFLGSFRSTIITSIALPNSLISAFILMIIAGFTVNVMTLLAMSLAVGLLIDDAIVVRENIFRHIELGKTPKEASLIGTSEVLMAVIATTATVIAVFAPIAFLDGMVGQFFKQFGLTVCFIMIISLLDALAMAPMLSAYFAGSKNSKINHTNHKPTLSSKIQGKMVSIYEKVISFSIKHYLLVIFSAIAIFAYSIFVLKGIGKTFISPSDNGEFLINIEKNLGTNIDDMTSIATEIDQKIRSDKNVELSVLSIGSTGGNANSAYIFVKLVPFKQRNGKTTNQIKEEIRTMLKLYSSELKSSSIRDTGGFETMSTGSTRPFAINVISPDLDLTLKTANEIIAKIKDHPDLKDVDTSYRPGKPEVILDLNQNKLSEYGVLPISAGKEIRTLIEGTRSAIFRENGYEYYIRTRLQEDQRDIINNFNKFYVPNINNRLVKLSDIATKNLKTGPSVIYRQDRGRYIQIYAAINPLGKGGLSKAISDTKQIIEDMKLPPNVRYVFMGQAKDFEKLNNSIIFAVITALIFMYLVLASLYESFTQPILIMITLPLAASGSFFGLKICGVNFDMFSMIGCIMLIGIAAKNSILLVDCANKLRESAKQTISLTQAITEAGKLRIRPIIMTSAVLIAGMIPIAIGLNEASKQRTGMGIVMVGGLISSTFLTLIVIPAIYSLLDNLSKTKIVIFLKCNKYSK